MAFFEAHLYSPALGLQTTVNVLLPDPDVLARSDAPLPTLYLLHGMSDDQTMWMRNTRVELFAKRYRMAVVMPAADLSFYMDMAHGNRYYTYIGQELPDAMEAFFPLSKKREDRFVAGLSMGGYGSFALALNRPDRYAAAASFSGCLALHETPVETASPMGDFDRCMQNIFGTQAALQAGAGNLFAAAERLAATPDRAPRLYMACGDRDSLLGANEAFYARYGKPLSIEYHVSPGSHSWVFWDHYIELALKWMGLPKAELAWDPLGDDQ